MQTISIIQPDEFGSDFQLVGGVWKVNFPIGEPNIDPVSANAGNAVVHGTDGGAYLGQHMLLAYALVQDNATKKIHLYGFPVGSVFDIDTAILISTVNMVDLQAVFDDVAIDGTVLTFTDANSGQTLTIDTDTLQRIASINGVNTIGVNVLNGVVTPSILISSNPDNAITTSEVGLLVDGAQVVTAAKNAINGANLNDSTYLYDAAANVIRHNVAGNELAIPQVKILNSKGDLVGLLDDLAPATTTYSSAVPLDYSPFL